MRSDCRQRPCRDEWPDLDTGAAEIEVRDKLRALLSMHAISDANLWKLAASIDPSDIAMLLAEPDASKPEDEMMEDDDSDRGLMNALALHMQAA